MTIKVLMVDDDASMRRLVQTVCEETGYTCCVGASGEEALELFQREWPDVVVLDVMMPKVDGFEVCRRIRAVDENVPCCFCRLATALSTSASGSPSAATTTW